ncbi:hypothetical protein BA895_05890 [Humibacillus sp. DSM 29435]|uniref:hypothetical protein n=1 Tax=Humibacillus sp. DSM 29435 TaxID=1869167 RepID=UPI000872D34D|nr:hypothetical protein [Humibacillus sp. DSM 29435]OFE15277.1 hypothetical protein BA895_05890 [Humibacillus sp. DSM 29435]
MFKNLRRIATVAALGVTPVIVSTSAADAGGASENYYVKRADTTWVDRGPVTALFAGNVHRGVISTADDVSTPGFDYLDGRIEAWSCPSGATVPQLYSHGEPEAPATECLYRGARELSFRGAKVTYAKNLTSAHITGTATAQDVTGVRPSVRLPVNITLTAVGRADTDVSLDRFVDEDGTKVTHRSTMVMRTATVSGSVGPILLGDEPSDVTESGLSSQQDLFRRS